MDASQELPASCDFIDDEDIWLYQCIRRFIANNQYVTKLPIHVFDGVAKRQHKRVMKRIYKDPLYERVARTTDAGITEHGLKMVDRPEVWKPADNVYETFLKANLNLHPHYITKKQLILRASNTCADTIDLNELSDALDKGLYKCVVSAKHPRIVKHPPIYYLAQCC